METLPQVYLFLEVSDSPRDGSHNFPFTLKSDAHVTWKFVYSISYKNVIEISANFREDE